MGKWIAIVAGALVLAALAGVGGYFLGTSRAEARIQATMGGFPRGRMSPDGLPGGFPSGTPFPDQDGQARAPGRDGTMGVIVSIEGDTMTLTAQDETVEVQVTDTTLVQKSMSVGLEQLEVGEQVMVSGTPDNSGVIVARSIQAVRAGQSQRIEQQ